MSANPRVVCWLNCKEWVDIYQCLYNFNDAQLQRKGLDRVLAWNSRSGGKLPLAIESTADLVLAHLTDSQSLSFTKEKQLILSMALVRFVNGMTDMNQKGVYARSVHTIAEEIGLPDWLVDLRHEATHANLPSQDTLQAGITVALSWLQEEYWEVQFKLHRDLEQQLCSLIEKYLAEARVKKTKKKNLEKQSLKVQSFAKDVVDFVSTNDLWSGLPDVLLKHDFSHVSPEDYVSYELKSGRTVSEDTVKIWLPLFKALDEKCLDFLTMFIISALQQYSNMSMTINGHCLPWVFYLMKSSIESTQTFKSKLPWLTLLEVCLRYPNFLQRNFVLLILNEATVIPNTQKKKIRSLVDIFCKKNPVGQFPEDIYEIKTIEQFQDEQKKLVLYPPTKSLQDSGWSLDYSDTRWHEISFGEILGCDEQSVGILELPIFDVVQSFNTKHINEKEREEERTDQMECQNDSNSIDYCHCENSLQMLEELQSTQAETKKLEIILF